MYGETFLLDRPGAFNKRTFAKILTWVSNMNSGVVPTCSCLADGRPPMRKYSPAVWVETLRESSLW
ncbi:hypothetical protein BDV36DRAFT_259804 [Aspergillus pseudocaelatus]|uniref:Uncharacterized protein n=1 Tax=Aspergillus pseudocaelatus TaxID=1825620 RepID=A0ABQ6WHC4_9EURO|nr:hypothetical protein BDV36DRAFT_259804 [Aspergillus pseudocaelatus]